MRNVDWDAAYVRPINFLRYCNAKLAPCTTRTKLRGQERACMNGKIGSLREMPAEAFGENALWADIVFKFSEVCSPVSF